MITGGHAPPIIHQNTCVYSNKKGYIVPNAFSVKTHKTANAKKAVKQYKIASSKDNEKAKSICAPISGAICKNCKKNKNNKNIKWEPKYKYNVLYGHAHIPRHCTNGSVTSKKECAV
jgi:hypothetical protein